MCEGHPKALSRRLEGPRVVARSHDSVLAAPENLVRDGGEAVNFGGEGHEYSLHDGVGTHIGPPREEALRLSPIDFLVQQCQKSRHISLGDALVEPPNDLRVIPHVRPPLRSHPSSLTRGASTERAWRRRDPKSRATRPSEFVGNPSGTLRTPSQRSVRNRAHRLD